MGEVVWTEEEQEVMPSSDACDVEGDDSMCIHMLCYGIESNVFSVPTEE